MLSIQLYNIKFNMRLRQSGEKDEAREVLVSSNQTIKTEIVVSYLHTRYTDWTGVHFLLLSLSPLKELVNEV